MGWPGPGHARKADDTQPTATPSTTVIDPTTHHPDAAPHRAPSTPFGYRPSRHYMNTGSDRSHAALSFSPTPQPRARLRLPGEASWHRSGLLSSHQSVPAAKCYNQTNCPDFPLIRPLCASTSRLIPSPRCPSTTKRGVPLTPPPPPQTARRHSPSACHADRTTTHPPVDNTATPTLSVSLCFPPGLHHATLTPTQREYSLNVAALKAVFPALNQGSGQHRAPMAVPRTTIHR
ncbi:unnamed protein product [Gadus morhua 'NCC']